MDDMVEILNANIEVTIHKQLAAMNLSRENSTLENRDTRNRAPDMPAFLSSDWF